MAVIHCSHIIVQTKTNITRVLPNSGTIAHIAISKICPHSPFLAHRDPFIKIHQIRFTLVPIPVHLVHDPRPDGFPDEVPTLHVPQEDDARRRNIHTVQANEVKRAVVAMDKDSRTFMYPDPCCAVPLVYSFKLTYSSPQQCERMA